MYEALMVRYGELGLKGKNKAQFINRLARNMEYALQDLGERKVESTWGRIMVPLAADLPDVVAVSYTHLDVYKRQVQCDVDALEARGLQVSQGHFVSITDPRLHDEGALNHFFTQEFRKEQMQDIILSQ